MRSSALQLSRIASMLLMLAIFVLGSCSGLDPIRFSGDVNVLLSRGTLFSNSLAGSAAEELSDAEVLALGYLERARVGMGSPFRLIEFAMRDPGITEEVQEPLAYAILAMTLQGRVYVVEPEVLDLVQLAGPAGSRRAGQRQLQLIERQIRNAPTATSGERAVRLGYRLAQAERSITGVPQSIVAHVAALVADRRRAQEDASLLLRTAAETGVDPLELLPEWRRKLRFRVEAPAMAAVSVREEEVEAIDGPQVALSLRTLAQRMSAPSTFVRSPSGDRAGENSLLRKEVAERLLALAADRDYPAQAPVAVAVSINRDELLGTHGLEPWQYEARERFAEAAWNEERLVAARQILRASGAAKGPRLSLIELQAATFLRVWNQEEPWFPGDPAPAAREIEARFGLAAVEFAPDLPATARDYHLRMLGRGLADLQRVLPTASIRGLRIHIGPLPQEMRALALHEPRTRTLYLPPLTGSGTLAHEIAHDLDWQLARVRYNVRGGYATDLAVRAQRGDRIATSMTGLAAALTRPGPSDAPPNPHESRPAEVFARGTDWFVAAVLASEGRTGGYLTSFQDAALTGYGTTRGPDVGGGAVPALVNILDGIAPVVERTREWALDTYGPRRTLTPWELTNAILDAGRELSPQRRLSAIISARDRSLLSVGALSCRLSSAEGMRRLTTAQRNLVEAATGAAARGAAIDAVRELGTAYLGAGSHSVVNEWIHWRLYGAPEPVDSALVDLAPAFDDIFSQAYALVAAEPETPGGIFAIGAGPTLCGGNPFAAVLRPGRRAEPEPGPLPVRPAPILQTPPGTAWRSISPEGPS